MIRSLLLASALFAAPALAQEASKDAAAPAKPPAAERPALNLRLDNASSWATNSPAGKEAARDLPTLGGDARKIEPTMAPVGGKSEGGPYPKDTAPGGK